MFKKMRDQGKFSKKFKGKHSYFLYLEPIKEKNKKNKLKVYVNDNEYKSPPPTPRYRFPKDDSDFMNKYFNKQYIPNKYSVNN